MKNIRLFVALFLLFGLGGPLLAAINCSNPNSNVERLICTSSRASVAHEQLAFSYNLAMRRGVDIKMLQETQIDWYENVLSVCNDVNCVVQAMDERSYELENY
jgi:uncharacterized protein